MQKLVNFLSTGVAKALAEVVTLRCALIGRAALPTIKGPGSQTSNVNPLEVGGDFSVVGLPVPVQVPIGDVGYASVIDPCDHVAVGVVSRVQLVAGCAEDRLPRRRTRVEGESDCWRRQCRCRRL